MPTCSTSSFQKFVKKKKIRKIIKKVNYSKIKSDKISKALKMIKNSKRPLILVGNGVHISKAEKRFLNFLKKTNLPFTSTWNASDIAPSNHKFYFGCSSYGLMLDSPIDHGIATDIDNHPRASVSINRRTNQPCLF